MVLRGAGRAALLGLLLLLPRRCSGAVPAVQYVKSFEELEATVTHLTQTPDVDTIVEVVRVTPARRARLLCSSTLASARLTLGRTPTTPRARAARRRRP